MKSKHLLSITFSLKS